MSGPTENRASRASRRPGGADNVFSLTTALRMLGLVRRIVEEITSRRQRLSRLCREKDRLDRDRRTLAWPERARRYQLQDDLAGEERGLREATAELEELGLVLQDRVEGQVGFPTLVGGRRAFFTWRPGEEGLRHWHFLGENALRQIPVGWMKAAESCQPGRK